jgi:hypothetical protein
MSWTLIFGTIVFMLACAGLSFLWTIKSKGK